MKRLYVLYDERCALCTRVRDWLAGEPTYVELVLIAAQDPEVTRRFGLAVAEVPEELVVIDDAGGVYRGPDAFLMCLWGLVEWRGWAERLSTPSAKPLARALFGILSSGREHIAKLLFGLRDDRVLAWRLSEETERARRDGDLDDYCSP